MSKGVVIMKTSLSVKFLLFFVLFSISSQAADQSNFNRSRISHSWNSSQISQGFDPTSALGQTSRGILTLQIDQVTAPYKLVDNNDNLLTEVVDSFSRIRLGYGFHLNRDWFFGVSVPFDSVKSKPFTAGVQHPDILTDGFNQTYSGLGDIELLARKRLEALSLRWNWVLEMLATLPTGDENSFNTDGDYSIGLRLAFNKFSGRENQFSTYGFIGGRYSPGSRVLIDPIYQPFEAEKRLEFGLGLRYRVSDQLGLFSDFGGFLSFPFDDGQNPIEISLGSDYVFNKTWKIYAGVGIEGVSGEQFSNDSRFFLGLKKMLTPLNKSQQEKFAVSSYPVQSSSYDALLDSVTSETSLVKKIVGKARSAFFISGGSTLSREGRLQIIDIASHLIKNKDHVKKVKLAGFTDSSGSKRANILLSRKRAFEVKKALINYGVGDDIFEIVSHGESRQKEADIFGKQGNRRAEIYISSLDIKYLNMPSAKGLKYHNNFYKNSKISTISSESYAREELFPRPFKFNGTMVSKFTILTADNLTWGDVSEETYGTRKFKDILRSLNYNRKPALGDIIYFMDFKTEGAQTFSYFKW